MGKATDLIKKIRGTKGTFHADGQNKGQKSHGANRSRRDQEVAKSYLEKEEWNWRNRPA